MAHKLPGGLVGLPLQGQLAFSSPVQAFGLKDCLPVDLAYIPPQLFCGPSGWLICFPNTGGMLMPKRSDIRKVMIIGSGPSIIGQAGEFDYSGTQACKALRKLEYEICLVNSNPATIMTDPGMAEVTCLEPLTPEYMAEIIRQEHPDALLPNLGGQTGLTLPPPWPAPGSWSNTGSRSSAWKLTPSPGGGPPGLQGHHGPVGAGDAQKCLCQKCGGGRVHR